MGGPDITARRLDGAGNGIVNEAVFVFDPGRAELLDVFIQVNTLEYILELPVIDLGYGIFGREQQVLAQLERLVHAGAGKAFDGLIQVMHAGNHAGLLELMHKLAGLVAV